MGYEDGVAERKAAMRRQAELDVACAIGEAGGMRDALQGNQYSPTTSVFSDHDLSWEHQACYHVSYISMVMQGVTEGFLQVVPVNPE